MKKILLTLIFLSSFLFASSSGDVIFFNRSYYKLENKIRTYYEIFHIGDDPTHYNICQKGYGFLGYTGYMITCGGSMEELSSPFGYKFSIDEWSFSPVSSCPPGQKIDNGVCKIFCLENEFEVNGQCFPHCPSGQTNDPITGQCVGVCTTGSHWDSNLSTPACVGDIAYGSKMENSDGSFLVFFADNALMYCRSDGKCVTTNLDGKVIDNHWYEGSIPEAPNVYSDLFDATLNGLGNIFGRTLQFAGYTLGLSSSGGGLLLGDNPVLGVVNPGTLAGAGLITLGNLLVDDNKKVFMTPTTQDPIKVNIVNSANSSDSFESVSQKTPSDGSPVFSPDGVYTYRQITEANYKTIWDNAAGAGTLPPTALIRGSDIIYPTNKPDTAIVNSPNQVEIIKTNSDNSAQSVVINKSDLANTASSGTDLPYTQKHYDAPVVNNNGTVTQPSTSTPTSTSPKNNNSTATNPSTGATTTANAANTSGTANTSDGKSIDLSGVTGRLDQLGNQLTKLNAGVETGNGFLSGIKGNSESIKGSLNGIQGAINTSSDGLTEQSWTNGIPTDYSVFETWRDAWTNLKSDFDSVTQKGDELKQLVSDGNLLLNLPLGSVQQCPYNGEIDLVFAQIPLSFDFCLVFSPLRAVFYTIFYLFFVFVILFSSLKILMRMA